MEDKYAIVTESLVPVRKLAAHTSEMSNQLLFGETVKLLTARGFFVQVMSLHDNYIGWVAQSMITAVPGTFWQENKFRLVNSTSAQAAVISNNRTTELWLPKGAVFPSNPTESTAPGQLVFSINERQFSILTNQTADIQPLTPEAVVKTALSYENTPYLWGGRSSFGIDCSGLVQQVFRFHGLVLPRDAWQQATRGELIVFSDCRAGDVAFFHEKGRIIHTGIILDKNTIIHASNHVKISLLTESGILDAVTNNLTHRLQCVKRFIVI
jgi:cell wall-associated NlpC family hydrolase